MTHRDHAPSRQRDESANAPAWQPIETAPKDGTRILLFHEVEPGGLRPAIVPAKWFDDGWLAGWDADDGVLLWAEGRAGKGPTHWYPLPPGPLSSRRVPE